MLYGHVGLKIKEKVFAFLAELLQMDCQVSTDDHDLFDQKITSHIVVECVLGPFSLVVDLEATFFTEILTTKFAILS